MKNSPLSSLLGKDVLFCDGAMGTQLMARGMKPGECGELWNQQRPDDVMAIHQAYVNAGCNLITTNTFGGTRTSLQRHGQDLRVRELNAAGARVAKQAAGNRAFVLGDVGPFGDFLEPVGDWTIDRLAAVFSEQIEGLLEGGADGIVIETMADPAEVAVATRAARKLGDWPVIVTYSFAAVQDTFRTMMGASVQDAVRAAIDNGANVVGTNCGTGLSLADYRRLAAELVRYAGATPVIIQPNAGAPQSTPQELLYTASPDDMAALVPDLRALGVKVIGGCCGTTPAHLKAMTAAKR